MTSQIAVFNLECVAVASDSVMTISNGRQERTLSSSEKVFDLGPAHKVVAVSSGEARFMKVPWTVLLREWQTRLAEPLATVGDYAGDRWAQCHYGYPSTHILKPVARPHIDMIFNEEYASRIARALGLAPYATWIESFEGTDALVIERYDRDDAVPGHRLHQEDFNQVLGASGAEKYQEHGGKVSLGRIASIVASTEGPVGLVRLLTVVTLAVCVGNLDMHAKNISLIHMPDGSSRLAPAYDVVPLTHYPGIDGRMAMAINDVYEHARIRRSDLIAEAGRWGMGAARAGEVVDAAVGTIRSTVQQEEPHARALAGLQRVIGSVAARIGEHVSQP